MLENIAAVLSNSIYIFLYAVEICILARVILSWFMADGENIFTVALYYLTEPFVLPVRTLMNSIPAFSGSMFDFSYAVTTLILTLVLTFMPGVTI